jgi:hypothetical protein
MPSSQPPKKYGDLDIRLVRSARAFKQYVYVGSRGPCMKELENCTHELFSQNMYSIKDLRLNGCGYDHVKGAPVAPDTQNGNAIWIIFDSKKVFNSFLSRPIPPCMEGISLSLHISRPHLL